ncbi:hypothetical protein V5N11_007046 [Cardamine amara subsp. amara]|uniref:CCHC-type domain-containing protein n=1 Tax=Cardamine amara subsp. amara TaxID=228776 RepID=A0ABD1AL08_CARAN
MKKLKTQGSSNPSNTTRLEAKPFGAEQFEKAKTTTRTSNIKCYKCQGIGHYANECTNKRIMVLKENGDYESEDEEQPESKPKEEEDPVELPATGNLLVAMRTLSIQTKTMEQAQRANLRTTRDI